jgi:hypothetical protein
VTGGLVCVDFGEEELDDDCVVCGPDGVETTGTLPGFGECIATTKKVVPNANATKRKNRLEIVAATSAPKILKLPPSRAINTRIAPKTNAPIFKFSGMNVLSNLVLMIAAYVTNLLVQKTSVNVSHSRGRGATASNLPPPPSRART